MMTEPIENDNFLVDKVSIEDASFAGFWTRLGASLIDALIVSPLLFIGL